MDKVTRQCPQTTTFEKKGEPKRYRTEVLPLTSLTTYRQAKPALSNISGGFCTFYFLARHVTVTVGNSDPCLCSFDIFQALTNSPVCRLFYIYIWTNTDVCNCVVRMVLRVGMGVEVKRGQRLPDRRRILQSLMV